MGKREKVGEREEERKKIKVSDRKEGRKHFKACGPLLRPGF